MLKKIVTTALALGLCAICCVGFAGITRNQAITIAMKEVLQEAGKKTEVFSTQEKNSKFEIELTDSATQDRYEVDIDKATGKIIKMEIEHNVWNHSNNVFLDGDGVRALVLAEYPDAIFHKLKLKDRHHGRVYEVEFSNRKYREAEVEINADTGKFVKRELIYRLGN